MWRLAATLLVVVTLVVDRGARQVRAAGPAFDDDDDDDNRVGLIHSFIHLPYCYKPRTVNASSSMRILP